MNNRIHIDIESDASEEEASKKLFNEFLSLHQVSIDVNGKLITMSKEPNTPEFARKFISTHQSTESTPVTMSYEVIDEANCAELYSFLKKYNADAKCYFKLLSQLYWIPNGAGYAYALQKKSNQFSFIKLHHEISSQFRQNLLVNLPIQIIHDTLLRADCIFLNSCLLHLQFEPMKIPSIITDKHQSFLELASKPPGSFKDTSKTFLHFYALWDYSSNQVAHNGSLNLQGWSQSENTFFYNKTSNTSQPEITSVTEAIELLAKRTS